MKEYKVALAITPKLAKQLTTQPAGELLQALTQKRVRTPDDTYFVYFDEMVEIGAFGAAWDDLLHTLEGKRHALITISEDGEIWTDIETEDEDGCDEEFGEILGWKASIVLWSDPDDELV